jgi:hypothetical protein
MGNNFRPHELGRYLARKALCSSLERVLCHLLTTLGFLFTMLSMNPGPWWLKPLWSFRQQVDVSR